MKINLNSFNDAWYEANLERDWRNIYRDRRGVKPSEKEKQQFFIEDAFHSADITILPGIEKFEQEATWNRVQIFFNQDYLDTDCLKVLFDTVFEIDGKEYSFAYIEAYVYEEYGYGYDESLVSSSYSRISAVFKDATR